MRMTNLITGDLGSHRLDGFRNRAISGRGLLPPREDCCEFPKSPFEDINPSNSSSWYTNISKFMSGLLRTEACLENGNFNGIVNDDPNFNPQSYLGNKFKITILLTKMYDLLKAAAEKAKLNKEAEKETSPLALAAK